MAETWKHLHLRQVELLPLRPPHPAAPAGVLDDGPAVRRGCRREMIDAGVGALGGLGEVKVADRRPRHHDEEIGQRGAAAGVDSGPYDDVADLRLRAEIDFPPG